MKETQVKRNDALVSDGIVLGVKVMWSETQTILETLQKDSTLCSLETEGFLASLVLASKVLHNFYHHLHLFHDKSTIPTTKRLMREDGKCVSSFLSFL